MIWRFSLTNAVGQSSIVMAVSQESTSLAEPVNPA
jgi:hypothetical protein